MKKIAIIGSFCKGCYLLDGQTVKTKTLASELLNIYGKDNVLCIDTYGKINNILSVLKCIWVLFFYRNIMILPAQNALKVLAPWLTFWNTFFKRRTHYVVIGGWLNGYLDAFPIVEKSLHKFHYIYVETQTMKNALIKRGFTNIIILPNCKDLQILTKKDMETSFVMPYKLVTFSRVMQQKGIEDALRVVSNINLEAKKEVFALDIYGQVDPEEIEWFEEVKAKYNLMSTKSILQYKGEVSPNKSVEILSNYFALLFPTRFYTEGIPGTIIDSYAAGIPVISAKWESFNDVVNDGITGIGFEFENWEELKNILIHIGMKPEIIYQKKAACLKRATDFLPSNVVPIIDLK